MYTMNVIGVVILGLCVSTLKATDCKLTGKTCVSNCKNMANGDYQSCKGCHDFVVCGNGKLFDFKCPANLEFDDNAKRCVEHSTTCKECWSEADDIMDLSRFAAVEEEPEVYSEEIRVNHLPHPKKCKSTGSGCVSDCTGKKDGDYQSCHGCDVYVSCVGGLRYDDRPCAPGGLVWDDKKKRCEYNSTTCHGCAHNVPCHATGPCCITSCRGLPDGDYQSCRGCTIYASCTNQRLVDKRPCAPVGTLWDDNKKLCDWYSNTCFHCKK